jgi:hypothetical protein
VLGPLLFAAFVVAALVGFAELVRWLTGRTDENANSEYAGREASMLTPGAFYIAGSATGVGDGQASHGGGDGGGFGGADAGGGGDGGGGGSW